MYLYAYSRFRLIWFLSVTVFVLQETIKVVQPLLLGKIIMYFENYDPDDRTSLYMVSGYGAAMSLSAFGLMILQLLYYYHVQRIGMKIRVAMCHMIYTKVSEDSRLWWNCCLDAVLENIP